MSVVQRFEVAAVADLDTRVCKWCPWPESHHRHPGLNCLDWDVSGSFKIGLTTYRPQGRTFEVSDGVPSNSRARTLGA